MTDQTRRTLPQCLTIAGSDSGGGAGIQADLKSFQANGVFGMSVITSITAQNTVEVTEAYDLPTEIITAQLRAIFDDFDVAAVKTGMLSSTGIIDSVCHFWKNLPSAPPLVVDPVMISKSGYRLLKSDAVDHVKRELLPLAVLVTPNRHEAELLSGIELKQRSDLDEAARRILALGVGAVLIKGGHLEGDGLDPAQAVDYLYDARGGQESFASPRFDTTSTHGTGCTYSAAICAWLGRGVSLPVAVANAKGYVEQAIRHGLAIGHGHGPTDHFYFLRESVEESAPPAPPRRGWKP
jgi:hydroxymethylpyrimidine/phosphomethylpyrimidine kinase